MFKEWTFFHPLHFEDENLLLNLEEFVSSNSGSSLSAEIEEVRKRPAKKMSEPPALFKGSKSPDEGVLYLRASDVAHTLAHLEYLHQVCIPTQELVEAKWEKEKGACVHVERYVRWTDSVSYWVQCQVLVQAEAKQRSKVIARFLEIAKICLSLNSYASAMQIYVGLFKFTSLKQTWSLLEGSSSNFFKLLHKLFSYEKSFKTYRTCIGHCFSLSKNSI